MPEVNNVCLGSTSRGERRGWGGIRGRRKFHDKFFVAEINVSLKVDRFFPITMSDGSFLSALS